VTSDIFSIIEEMHFNSNEVSQITEELGIISMELASNHHPGV